MKIIRLLTFATLALIMLGCVPSAQQHEKAAKDPLDLWNEGPVKTSILNFIKTVTDETNPAFIPVPDRVAVTDMDGTFLLEKPFPVNMDIIIRMMIEQIAANPALPQKQPYKAINENDWAYFDTLGYNEDGIYSLLRSATAGYTEDQYREYILNYYNTVRDKRFNRPYNQLVFAPMVQLFRYLQANQFEIYIVSGSDPQFTRTLCEESAGIPVQNVTGTTILTKWVETDTGSVFVRVNEIVQPINDEGGKAVNILYEVGKVPVIAMGNSPGDYPMLQFSKNSPNSLQMIINHDDAEREYVYDKDTMTTLCQNNGWLEVSMKNDFKVVFNQ
ncbi:MAG: HAD family hydrolase [Bacteroidales bacterium]|nr:HAD family hydrolase [Bacteroidales bacterium]